MTLRILVTAPYFIPAVDGFRDRFERNGIELVVVPVEQQLSADELMPLLQDVDAIICGDDELNEDVLRSAPRLRAIAKWGTGVDAIDRDAAAALGIAVSNTPGAFDDPVADTALAFILSFSRQIPWTDREVRAGRWTKLPGIALAEATVGLVGFGAVGRAVARRVQACGATVVATDIAPIEAPGVRAVDLDTLLADSDFVSLHAVLTPQTYHLIGTRELELMKRSAYLINTARGRLVDEAALVDALEGGHLAGAGLDVFEREPLPANSPLRRLDNCLLGTHNSNSSPAAWERVHENTVRNVLADLGIEP